MARSSPGHPACLEGRVAAGTISAVKRLSLALGVLAAVTIPSAALGVGPPPVPGGSAWLLADGATGEVLAEHNADAARPMASLTKMLTALVAIDSGALDRVITVPPSAAAVGESSVGLRPGERVVMRNLLRALLVQSGNDAAVAIATGVAGSESAFVDLMNEKAKEMGLTATHFANPHGLDAAGHQSSPRDLLTVAKAVMKQPVLRDIVGRRTITIPGPDGPRTLTSENDLLSIMPSADGVKTGHTDGAGYVEVAHATSPSLGVGLFAVVMGEGSRAQRARDAKALLEWGFSNYARPTVVAKGTTVVRVPVQGAPDSDVALHPASAVMATVRLGKPIRLRITAPSAISAPLARGQGVGTVAVLQGDTVVARSALVAPVAVASPGFTDHLIDAFEGIRSVFT